MKSIKFIITLTFGIAIGVLGVAFYQLFGKPTLPTLKVIRKATPEDGLAFFLQSYLSEIVTNSEKLTLDETRPVRVR